ncbi:unnamed protein product, partial [Prorocentrum cordatum]
QGSWPGPLNDGYYGASMFEVLDSVESLLTQSERFFASVEPAKPAGLRGRSQGGWRTEPPGVGWDLRLGQGAGQAADSVESLPPPSERLLGAAEPAARSRGPAGRGPPMPSRHSQGLAAEPARGERPSAEPRPAKPAGPRGGGSAAGSAGASDNTASSLRWLRHELSEVA